MKLKATPDSDTVRYILTERIGEESRLLDEDNTALAKLTSGESAIYNPYQATEVSGLKQRISSRTQYLADRKTELRILESHEAPRVLVEIDF